LTNIYYNFIETFEKEARGNKKDNKKSKKKGSMEKLKNFEEGRLE